MKNAVLNIFSENSCLTREMAALPISQVEFVVIPYIFSLCLGGFVAVSQLCKTKPICCIPKLT